MFLFISSQSIQMYCTCQSNLMQFSQQNLFILYKKPRASPWPCCGCLWSISLSLATVWLTSYQIWVLIFTVEVWNVKTKVYSGISENEFILKREVNIKKSRLRPQLWTNHDCLVGKGKKKEKAKDVNLKRICAIIEAIKCEWWVILNSPKGCEYGVTARYNKHSKVKVQSSEQMLIKAAVKLWMGPSKPN